MQGIILICIKQRKMTINKLPLLKIFCSFLQGQKLVDSRAIQSDGVSDHLPYKRLFRKFDFLDIQF